MSCSKIVDSVNCDCNDSSGIELCYANCVMEEIAYEIPTHYFLVEDEETESGLSPEAQRKKKQFEQRMKARGNGGKKKDLMELNEAIKMIDDAKMKYGEAYEAFKVGIATLEKAKRNLEDVKKDIRDVLQGNDDEERPRRSRRGRRSGRRGRRRNKSGKGGRGSGGKGKPKAPSKLDMQRLTNLKIHKNAILLEINHWEEKIVELNETVQYYTRYMQYVAEKTFDTLQYYNRVPGAVTRARVANKQKEWLDGKAKEANKKRKEKEAKKEEKSEAELLAEKIYDGIQKAREIAREVSNAFSDGVKSVGKSVTEPIKKTTDTIKDAGEKVGQEVKKTSEKVGQEVKKASEKVGQEVKKASEKVGKGIKEVSEKAGEGLKNAGEKVGEGLKEAGETVYEGMRETVKFVGSSTKELMEWVKNDAMDYFNEGLEYASTAVNAVKKYTGVQWVEDQTKEYVEKAFDEMGVDVDLEDIKKYVKEKSEEYADDLKGYAEKYTEEGFKYAKKYTGGDYIEAKSKEIVEKAQDEVARIKEKVGLDKMDRVLRDVTEDAKSDLKVMENLKLAEEIGDEMVNEQCMKRMENEGKSKEEAEIKCCQEVLIAKHVGKEIFGKTIYGQAFDAAMTDHQCHDQCKSFYDAHKDKEYDECYAKCWAESDFMKDKATNGNYSRAKTAEAVAACEEQ